jgi:hypothetical protein
MSMVVKVLVADVRPDNGADIHGPRKRRSIASFARVVAQ